MVKTFLGAFGSLALIALMAVAAPVDQVQAESVLPAEAPVVVQGECPTGDEWAGPVTSLFVIPAIDKGNYKDQNGDGLLCFRVPAGFCGNRGMGDAAPVCGAWVWKDNTN